MIGHLDKDHFLSIDKAQAYIDTKSPYLEELMINIPDMKGDTITKKRLAMGKSRDKG